MAGHIQHHTRLSRKQNPFFNLKERQRKEVGKTETNFRQNETIGGIVRIVKCKEKGGSGGDEMELFGMPIVQVYLVVLIIAALATLLYIFFSDMAEGIGEVSPFLD